MATEQFKEINKNLLEGYLEVRNEMKSKGYENITFSFKDYCELYFRDFLESDFYDETDVDEYDEEEELQDN